MSAFDTPWKIVSELRRYGLVPLAFLYFRLHGVECRRDWRVYGLPLIQRHRRSSIRIGARLQMRNWFSSNPIGVLHRTILATWSSDAEIVIGDHVGLTGTTLCAETSIRIGNRVCIGANCTLIDTDFHPLTVGERRRCAQAGQTRPIVIEDDVFIGMNSVILKGAIVGTGSVVGAGSVVTGVVPACSIVAGNPAKVVRLLDEDRESKSKIRESTASSASSGS